mgnify:CR=1 FL=1
MKVSVVILNWNGCDMLRSFLPSVVHFSEADGAVVYVADNGSTDASVAMLRREFPSVHLILLEENHGFADGYKSGIEAGGGRICSAAQLRCRGHRALACPVGRVYGCPSGDGRLPAEDTQLA